MSTLASTLRVRVNQIDHTLAPPGPLDNSTLPRVPIIRVYGESSTGRKACVHIHQVYPYFYVEYAGKMNPDSVNRFVARLSHSLNHAIAVSMKRNPDSPKSKFVRAVLLVKGVHFYGFHASYSPFLKVHIADPAYVNRAVTILQSGTVMKTRFRVYESHISYILQFMCDFGLYGCGWMDLGEVWERGRDEIQEGGNINNDDDESDIVFQSSPHFRQSRMPLEVDIAAHQILNRHSLTARNIHHKLTIPAPSFPPEPLVPSVRELWEDERRRRVAKGLSPSPEIPKDLSENSRGRGAEWVAEARWWEEIRKRIERESGKEKVLSNMGWERWVMTTFESIEALWEDEWKMWKPVPGRSEEATSTDRHSPGSEAIEENPYAATRADISWSQEHKGASEQVEADVDETMLSSQAMEQLVEQEETEWDKLVNGHRENEEDLDEENEATEDGPPPDDQFADDLAGVGSPSSKGSPSKRSNAFQEAWRKLARPARDRSNFLTIDDVPHTPRKRIRGSETGSQTPPRTPTKRSFRRNGSAASSDVFSPIRPARLVNSAVITGPTELNETTLRPSTIEATRRLRREHSFGVAGMEAFSELHYPTGIGAHTIGPSADSFAMDPAVPNLVTQATGSDIKGSGPQKAPQTGDGLEGPSKRRRLSNTVHDIVKDSLSSSNTPSSLPYTSSRETDSSHHRQLASTSQTVSYGLSSRGYIYSTVPPSTPELLGSNDEYNIPSKIYTDPYYSRSNDAPERPREYAGLVFHLKGGDGLDSLEEWIVQSNELAWYAGGDQSDQTARLDAAGVSGWEYASCPPSPKQVRRWLITHPSDQPKTRPKQPSQIEGPTQAHPYGLKNTPARPAKQTAREQQNMSAFSLEMFALSTGDRLPDPGVDEIAAVFYSYKDTLDPHPDDNEVFSCDAGVILVENSRFNTQRFRSMPLEIVQSELDLLNRLIDVVVEVNPDILAGWEIQAASWGYLSARANTYGLDLVDQISRASGRHGGGSDQWGMRTTSTFKVVGRHVLNLWRIMRAEQNFTSHAFEHVVFQILHRRTPRYSPQTLTRWYHSDIPYQNNNLLRYFSSRASMILEILDAAEVVTKTAEFARIFGVDFFSVLSRGSQFKVEAFMFRIAKPENFVLLSPSKQDVGKQNAAECMPLIMEPLSAFYNSPLVVLDFQSLYPSIMIAYNYCYSTCLGRVTEFKGQYKFGVTDLRQPAGLLGTLQEHINVAPNGMIYVKQDVRKGLLGRMLTELLDTRVMVKQAMKGIKDDKALRRVLDARQLGLKFIANVTYGYTSASYSGRMPAVEIADSIVQSGRETLEKAIRIIDSTKKWGARVVYGDTDSLFIYLRGKTKEQAFRIGYDMAETITAMNPAPVKLKFEKVYLPCVLMAKKRYVGFKFENPDDKEPGFDAKGIETVRRDGIPAQQKMTETCLKILFRTQDLSQVKDYCCRMWARLLENKVSVQDFIFAKEVKMGTYSDRVPPPPGVTVAARRMVHDPNDEPQYGERVPYVIVRGDPDSRLVDRAVSPEELLNNSQKHLDAMYYISRVLIPPLERIFNLVGADVRSWYEEMPKALRMDQPDSLLLSPRKAKNNAAPSNAFKIDEHFLSSHCMVCGALTPDGVCDDCRMDPQTTTSELLLRLRKTEDKLRNVQFVCTSCCGTAPAEPIECESLDCPWFFERKKVENKADSLVVIGDLVKEREEEARDDDVEYESDDVE